MDKSLESRDDKKPFKLTLTDASKRRFSIYFFLNRESLIRNFFEYASRTLVKAEHTFSHKEPDGDDDDALFRSEDHSNITEMSVKEFVRKYCADFEQNVKDEGKLPDFKKVLFRIGDTEVSVVVNSIPYHHMNGEIDIFYPETKSVSYETIYAFLQAFLFYGFPPVCDELYKEREKALANYFLEFMCRAREFSDKDLESINPRFSAGKNAVEIRVFCQQMTRIAFLYCFYEVIRRKVRGIDEEGDFVPEYPFLMGNLCCLKLVSLGLANFEQIIRKPTTTDAKTNNLALSICDNVNSLFYAKKYDKNESMERLLRPLGMLFDSLILPQLERCEDFSQLKKQLLSKYPKGCFFPSQLLARHIFLSVSSEFSVTAEESYDFPNEIECCEEVKIDLGSFTVTKSDIFGLVEDTVEKYYEDEADISPPISPKPARYPDKIASLPAALPSSSGSFSPSSHSTIVNSLGMPDAQLHRGVAFPREAASSLPVENAVVPPNELATTKVLLGLQGSAQENKGSQIPSPQLTKSTEEKAGQAPLQGPKGY